MPQASGKYFLTTPIYYVNARPHIGHAYTTLVADVLARRHRLLGNDTFFLTGTDEHGQKIERSAAAAGISPKQFTDQVSAEFNRLWQRMGLTNDAFIRTTDLAHKRGAQRLFATLYQRGSIYLSSYTGQYCVSEEIFVEGPPGTIGPDGRPTETVTEENFFFRLSEYQLELINRIESDELVIQPETRKNEVLSFLRGPVNERIQEGVRSLMQEPESPEYQPIQEIEEYEDIAPAGRAYAVEVLNDLEKREVLRRSKAGEFYVPGALRDLSVSRSSFSWGIPVPEPAASTTSKPHVMYVWLDALANYMSAVGYGDDSPEAQAAFAHYWPADLHLMSKEITRQHCIYWPAFLLAADLPLPRQVVAHGWLLFEDSKMSKSKGNIVRTETILDAFGTEVYAKQFPDSTKPDQDLFAADILRYFLLREIPFGQDGSFSFDALITRYNADLANGYGNLVSRTLSMIVKYFGGTIPGVLPHGTISFGVTHPTTPFKPNDVENFYQLCSEDFNRWIKGFDFSQSLTNIWKFVSVADGYLTIQAPWKVASQTGHASTDQASNDQLHEILYTAAEAIRLITALLYPVLPFATAAVWRQLGLGDIEQAARDGQLTNLSWGGLKPGTKLGPIAPIFPRADKGLAQIMADIESPAPVTSVASDSAEVPAPAEPQDPTHPGAGPRTGTLSELNPGSHVAGSTAETTERPGTPSHSQAHASGIFSGQQPADASPQIAIDDFAKVELRVAQILVAERIPKADKLLRLEVDLGYEKRQILSGIAEYYTPDELIGRRIVVITNLAPRKMRGLESHGMLLAASAPEGGKPALATFDAADTLPLGSRLK
jgi:methionyl-tRNA synthetase